MAFNSLITTLLLTFVCSVSKSAPRKECVVTYTDSNSKSQTTTIPISQEITTKAFGSFQVKIELKKSGSTAVTIEARGMKAMQSGSGTTKASLSNGNERIEVVCQ